MNYKIIAKKIIWFIFTIFTSIAWFGCDNDTISELNYESVEEEFGESIATFSLGGDDDIDELLAYNRKFLYSDFERELQYYDIQSNIETILAADIQTNKLIDLGNGIAYACTSKGLFRFIFENNSFSKEVECNCSDVEIYENEIYYTRVDDENNYRHIGQIFRLSDNFSFGLNENNYLGFINDFAVSSDGDFFVFDQVDRSIIRIDRNNAIEVYTSNNSPIVESNFGGSWWVLSSEDYLIFVGESGVQTPSMFLWSVINQSWIDLFPNDLRLFEDNNSLWTDMITSSYSDVTLYQNNLLISTNFGGCKGLQYWNVNSFEKLKSEDYQAFKFDNDNLNCVQGICIDGAMDNLVFYTQSGIITYFN